MACLEEEGAMEILEQRLHLVPSFTKEMLRDKVFGAYESDIEFQLVHLAMLPLYSEKFDANSALRQVLDGVYNAQAHSG